MGDGDIHPEKRGGKPHAPADPAHPFLIREALAVVVAVPASINALTPIRPTLIGDDSGTISSAEAATSVSPALVPVLNPRKFAIPPSSGFRYAPADDRYHCEENGPVQSSDRTTRHNRERRSPSDSHHRCTPTQRARRRHCAAGPDRRACRTSDRRRHGRTNRSGADRSAMIGS